MQINSDYLTRVLSNLVAINSINLSLVSDGAGEAEIAAYLVKEMGQLGLETHLDEVAENRFNAIGILHGRNPTGRRLMWNGHIDTVGVNGMVHPFDPQVTGGRLYGRGSQDMKGSLAAMLAAVQALKTAGIKLDGSLILACAADEEWGSLGSEDIARRYPADAAVVTEPTEMRICTAHRGFIGYEVAVHGRAAHGSRYQDGIDAILLMGSFLHELASLETELRSRPPHPLVGPPSIHASTIRGGTEMSTYPADCLLMLERRTVPGESVAAATAELQALLDRCAAADPRFKAELTCFMSRPAFETPSGLELLRQTQLALAARSGQTVRPQGVSFWTDAAILAEAGIPSVLLGPIGQGLHSAEEWVDLQSCVVLAGVLADIACSFCGEAF